MANVVGGTIKWTLDLDKSNFDSKMEKTSSKTQKSAKIMTKALLGIGIAAAAGLAMSIKRAASFETALSNISTLLSGDSTKAIAGFKKGILDMMSRVPVSADELGASAYAIVSAGITDTSDALKVLEKSAQLGTTGLGTTEEATTLMVLALNNFREMGMTTDKAANILFKTVKGGITTIADLSQSFGLVAPLAVDAGVTMEELSAATAALTQVNKSASISQNSLKAAFVSLAKPTEAAQELFEGLEVKTFPELIKKTGGMVAAFKAMKDETKGNTQQFAKAIGSGEALTSVISLLGGQSDAFNESLASMKDGTDALTEGFEKQKKTFANSMKILRNNIDIIAIKLGSKLLPPLAKFVTILAKKLGPAIDKVSKFLKENKGLLVGFAVILATLVTPAIIAWGVATKVALASFILGLAPLMPLALTLAAIAFVLFKVWTENWGGIRDITESVINAITKFVLETLIPTFTSLREKVDEVIKKLTNFANKITEIKDGALTFFGDKLKEITEFIVDHQTQLGIAAVILTTIFGPALAIAGTKAAIAGSKIAFKLTVQLVNLGKQAVIAAGKMIINLVRAFIVTSFHALVAAGKFFIAVGAMIATKIAALALGGAKVLNALRAFAVAGWAAAGPWAFVAAGVLLLVSAIALLTDQLEKLGLISERFNVLKQFKALKDIGFGGLQEFQTGGIVPGPIGTPQLAVVHGGEEIIPTGGKSKEGIVINQTNNITKETDMEAALRELGWQLSI